MEDTQRVEEIISKHVSVMFKALKAAGIATGYELDLTKLEKGKPKVNVKILVHDEIAEKAQYYIIHKDKLEELTREVKELENETDTKEKRTKK